MIGDPEYTGKHKHGVTGEGRPATGAHLMERKRHTEPKEIQKVHTPYRGHTQVDFTDGSTMLLERGEYVDLPKAGDFWPAKAEALNIFEEPEAPETLGTA